MMSILFTIKVVRPWRRLSGEEAVAAPSREVTKARLDRTWSSPGQWKVFLPMAEIGLDGL